MEKYFLDHVIWHIASGYAGRSLGEDAAEVGGAIRVERVVLDGLCAAEGVNYWSWDGVVELRPHGHIRIIGIRSEHASDGEALSVYAYNREHWVH